MHDYYLTKSDFKIARTCPTKLYYRKKGYPTIDDQSEFLALLADQGYLIESLARTFYPDGHWIGYRKDAESAAWETMSALSDHCTLFEATFMSGGKMARIDILVRRGNTIELIEIKSCGFDRQKNDELVQAGKPNLFRSSKAPSGISNDWRPHLEDAAYQTSILADIFPDAQIIPYLLMPDTSQPVQLDRLHRRFISRTVHFQSDTSQLPASDYNDDPRDIRRNPFLARVNVTDEVQAIMPEVRHAADIFLQSLFPSLQRMATPPSTNCRTCEFRVTEGQMRGFHECWGAMADVKPHILDLYYVRDIGRRDKPLADELIAQGKCGLFDLPEKHLTRKDGTIGERAKRQRVQITYTRTNQEWWSDELGSILQRFTYPLHFVDFETCSPAVPRYRGMRPFETIAFQWSCHTISTPNDQPRHSEWLQAADEFPNTPFADSLRRQIGDEGTILVWASHEASVLRSVVRQLVERGQGDSETAHWVSQVLDSGRIIDLNQLTLKHYFHPRMGGRTSLKVVADAVWQTNPGIRARLPRYQQDGIDGLISPYRALPPVTIGGKQVSVAEGTGAILAYYAMMDRASANAMMEVHQWRELLSQYCELDTLAMVMVWWHWRELTGQMH